MRRNPPRRFEGRRSFQFKMAGCLSEDEELQQIISLDDTDLDTNSSLPGVGTTTGFTVNDLIAVLDRVSSSKIKCEAELANTILANTREKKCLNPLCCFVSSHVDAIRECSDRIKKVKNNSIRAIKLEREFSTLRHAKRRSYLSSGINSWLQAVFARTKA